MSDMKIYSNMKNLIFERQKGKEDSFTAQFGDIIKAMVVKVENQKAALFVNEKFSFEADINKLKAGTKQGDELLFEVVKSDKNTFILKQLNTEIQKQTRKQLSTDEMMELFKQQGMHQEDTKADDVHIENQKKSAEAITRIRRKINGITGNATSSAINELIASGLSLEKISMDMLNSAVRVAETRERIDIPARERRDAPLKEVNKDNKDNKESNESEYSRLLKNNGLSDNKQNIARLESVISKRDEIKEINDDAIVAVLRSGKKLTIENIYKSKYSTIPQENKIKPEINGLEDEIGKFLQREGFAVNSENMELSKLLVGNDIALTADNLNIALFLRDIGEYDTEKILNLACENIKNNKRASDIEIYVEEQNEARAALLEEYGKTIETIPKITANNVENVIRLGREVTLRNLVSMNFSRIMPEAVSEEALASKRRLVEIQFKLTSEAALRLANKNININTMPIQEALNTLRNLERQGYENDFKVMGVPATEENIGEITDLYDKVKSIKPIVNNVFGDLMTKKVSFTVNGIHESSSRLADNYENTGTKVSQKYGDNFSKVRDQFGGHLAKLGIEATEENVKAAVILSRNDIEVNEENILRVKNIDSKINAVYDQLHPCIAVDMIRNNKNPANMHIDEVLEYIDKFNGGYGTGVKDKIVNYIMEMDNANNISSMTRESMIAIYRMLSMIQKDGSVALGVAIKKDSEITLTSLFNDAKYFQRTKAKKTDIDMKVDDKSDIKVRHAAEDSIINAVNSILDENAMGKTENNIKMAEDVLVSDEENKNRLILGYERINLMLNEIASKANAAALNQVIEENSGYMDLPLEEALRLLEEKKLPESGYINERYAQIINDMQNIPAQAIKWMEENNIPVTINNMFAAANLLKKPHFIADKLNETQRTDEIEIKAEFDESDLFERLPALSEALPQLIEDEPTSVMAERVNLIQSAVQLQNSIHQRPGNGYFQVPVKLHDKIGSVNMYILNENLSSSEEISIYMSLNTTNLGNVSMYINVTGEDAQVKVCVHDQASLRRLENSVSELTRFAEDAGYNITRLSFETEDEENILEKEIMPSGSAERTMMSKFEYAV